nr:alpha/beta fold hydrolase [Hymenobacter profundi]
MVPKLAPHFRCIALDYPGFGISTAGPGYGFTPREHSQVVEQVVEHLGLCDLRVMVQDWGGPIGLGFAGRRPDLIHSLIIGNTFAWPAQVGMVAFSKLFGSSLFRWLNRYYNLIARLLIPAGMNRQLNEAELAAYLGPFATPASRLPTWILPKEITHSHAYLAEVEAGLAKLREKPALLIWGEADGAFREPDRRRLQQHLPAHQVLLLPQVKHFIQENAPQEISTAILAHERRTAIPVA